MFNKSSKALIGCMAINSIVDLFILTFFTAYMLTISGNDIAFIAKFYMIVYFSLGLVYFLLVPLVKKYSQVNMVRLGAVLKAIFLLIVILLDNSIISHYIWLGALYGIFEALYWSGGNTLKNTIVESEKIKALISVISINARIIGIIFPIAFGVSIDSMSFTQIAIFVFCLVCVQAISTLFIKQVKTNSNKASYKEFFKKLKNDKQNAKIIQYTYIVMFLRGLQYFIPTFITYMIIYVYKTNTSLGILTTVASVTAIIVLVLFNVIKKADTNIFLYIGFAILESVSLMLSILFLQPLYIIIFQLVHTTSKTTIDALSESIRGTSIKDANLEKYMPESLAICELFLNGGRVVGYFSLFILGIVNSLFAVTILGCVFVCFLMMYNIVTGLLKVKIKRTKELNEKRVLTDN